MPRVKKVVVTIAEKPVTVQKQRPNYQLGMDFLQAITDRKKEKARGFFAQALSHVLEKNLLSKDISDGYIKDLTLLYEPKYDQIKNLLEDYLNLHRGSLRNNLNRFLDIKV